MLILKREQGQDIVINYGTPEEIVIRVVRTGSSVVKIGIDAPADTVVDRREIAEQKRPKVSAL